MRPIDTTTNDGLTTPANNDYTSQTNPNLGTSFSSPIVAGIAALMLSVNANLTPADLVTRLQSSASPFPANTANLPVCPNSDPTTGECACPATGQCGTGMVNALAAVNAALQPTTGGAAATPWSKTVTVNPVAPTVSAALSPASVAENVNATLTITLSNTNAFDLTQGAFNMTLPNNLTVAATPQTTTSCAGTGLDTAATYTTTSVSLVDRIIPAKGSCTIVMPVVSTMAGSYAISIAANALLTGPAGGNAAPATATLTVTAPSSGGGGGALGWPDILVAAGLVVASRRRGGARVREKLAVS